MYNGADSLNRASYELSTSANLTLRANISRVFVPFFNFGLDKGENDNNDT